MADFWREHGITQFMPFEIMNRGGSLYVDHMQYEAYPEAAEAREILAERAGDPVCPVPFIFLFVGWDGQHYLCCSDWKKEAPLGSVFDESFVDVVRAKLEHALSRRPVCRSCNLDPVNKVIQEIRARNEGESDDAAVERVIDEVVATSLATRAGVALLDPSTESLTAPSGARRRLIPVSGA
jgi:hypothetical protein